MIVFGCMQCRPHMNRHDCKHSYWKHGQQWQNACAAEVRMGHTLASRACCIHEVGLMNPWLCPHSGHEIANDIYNGSCIFAGAGCTHSMRSHWQTWTTNLRRTLSTLCKCVLWSFDLSLLPFIFDVPRSHMPCNNLRTAKHKWSKCKMQCLVRNMNYFVLAAEFLAQCVSLHIETQLDIHGSFCSVQVAWLWFVKWWHFCSRWDGDTSVPTPWKRYKQTAHFMYWPFTRKPQWGTPMHMGSWRLALM